jgi:tripartite-type tricarboxylate transporter receptor subunit TctC
MLGDQVAVTSGGVEALLPYVKVGKLKLLAVGATQRTALLPDVPTIREVGGADMLLSTSYSMYARAGTPPAVLAKMNAALKKVLASAEIQNFAAPRGLVAAGSKPADLDAQIAVDSERVGRLVREQHIELR